jgi:ribokinase
MAIFNIDSLNIDDVYGVSHIVRPGETLASDVFHEYPGGKGLNQSLAIARAGGRVNHVGLVGDDGTWLRDLLRDNGADTAGIEAVAAPSGRAIIQVDACGQNSIILFGGANRLLSTERIERALARGGPGDTVLAQNETSSVSHVLLSARRRGFRVCFNPAPMSPEVLDYPLDCVDLFILNETEAGELSRGAPPLEAAVILRERHPGAEVLLTMGKDGAVLFAHGERFSVEAVKVEAVDTTGAGDTFIGYFLAGRQGGMPPEECLRLAARAAAMSVTRHGAADSIPGRAEVDAWVP